MFLLLAGMSLTPALSDVSTIPDDVIVRRMVALFDYDPWESSPNLDSEVSAVMNSHQYSTQFMCFHVHHHLTTLCVPAGWAWLSFRRHHLCFRRHGPGWILSCEYHPYSNNELTPALFMHWFNFYINFRVICMDGEVWFHQTTFSRYPGIRGKCHTRTFFINAKSQTQRSFVSTISFF